MNVNNANNFSQKIPKLDTRIWNLLYGKVFIHLVSDEHLMFSELSRCLQSKKESDDVGKFCDLHFFSELLQRRLRCCLFQHVLRIVCLVTLIHEL